MIRYSKKDINKIKKWGMKTNPLVAINDYSNLKTIVAGSALPATLS